MERRDQDIVELLSLYFSNQLSEEDQRRVEKWAEEDPKNKELLLESSNVWEDVELLKSMRKFNSEPALKKVHHRIRTNRDSGIWRFLQQAAAVLILPLLGVSVYLALHQKEDMAQNAPALYTMTVPTGVRTQCSLPDGSTVWLNGGSTLVYPAAFKGEYRGVKLSGEGYFNVSKDAEHPFVVETNSLNVEVLGTQFNLKQYASDENLEVVLESGKVNLTQGSYPESKQLVSLSPGDCASYNLLENGIAISHVDVEKYTAWKDGKMIFREDSLSRVVNYMSRWYNVNIEVKDEVLLDYTYTATFSKESIFQVLELLKLTAPIDYRIKKSRQKSDNTFDQMEIVLFKKDV